MQHETKLYWFDFFRGLSALLVLLGHLRALLLVDYQDNLALDLLGKIFYFATGFGHQAVVVFFVLSGFFIIRSIHESVLRGTWHPGVYLFTRLSRLWIVLIPALLATLSWDSLGLSLFPHSAVYGGSIPTLPGINPIDKLGLSTFLGNAFFLQTIVVDTYGTNSALWSLANEFWYYVLFPLLYFSFDSEYSWRLRIGLLFLAVLLLYFIGWGIASGFMIWVMGGWTYLLYKRGWKITQHKLFRAMSIIAFVGGLCCIRLNVYPLVFNDYSLSLLTALMLGSLSNASMPGLLLKKLAVGLSEVSYSLYLFHLSFAAWLTMACSPFRQVYSGEAMLLYYSLLVVILIYCRLVYHLFERNTGNLKAIVLKRFSSSTFL